MTAHLAEAARLENGIILHRFYFSLKVSRNLQKFHGNFNSPQVLPSRILSSPNLSILLINPQNA